MSSTPAAVSTNRSTESSTFSTWPTVADDHRDTDRGPLPLVEMVDLGHRHVEAVPQTVDDRPDRRPLGLQRAALGHMEIETDRSRMHRRRFYVRAISRSS